jgi:hypothetical protein
MIASRTIYLSNGRKKHEWILHCPECGGPVSEHNWECAECGFSIAFCEPSFTVPFEGNCGECFKPDPQTHYSRHLAEVDRARDENYIPRFEGGK